MDQSSRTATLDAFREGRISLLAASDVAARGLDIPDVTHIFNFDVPWQADDYVHRIGRTGRAGKEGRSLTLVTPEDIKQLKDIEKMLGVDVTWMGDPPSAEDIADGSKRRRGRGGRSARPAAGGRSEARSGRPPPRSGARPRPGPARENGHRSDQATPPILTEERPRRDRAATPRPPRPEPAEQPSVVEARAPDARPPRREPAERNQARTDQPSGRPDRQNGRGQKQPQQPKTPRQPWEPREPRRQSDREDRGPTPVGLGDHVPAFLRKTTRSAQS
jgi:superfamily II DNA/RNA helicase